MLDHGWACLLLCERLLRLSQNSRVLMRLVKLFGHSHKLLLTLQIYYHGLFKIFHSANMHYIWYFRILYNKSVIVCNSDSSNSLRIVWASLQPGSMILAIIHRWCLFVLLGLLVLGSSSSSCVLLLCYMWSLCWETFIILNRTSGQQPALSHVLSLGKPFLCDICQASLLLLRWLLIFWVNTRPSPSVAA